MTVSVPVRLHDVLEQLTVARRRISNGVGAGVDGGVDGLLRRTAGCNDRNVGILFPDRGNDLRRLGGGGNIEDIRAGGNTLVDILLDGNDGGTGALSSTP